MADRCIADRRAVVQRPASDASGTAGLGWGVVGGLARAERSLRGEAHAARAKGGKRQRCGGENEATWGMGHAGRAGGLTLSK